jgi:hypothetical protein
MFECRRNDCNVNLLRTGFKRYTLCRQRLSNVPFFNLILSFIEKLIFKEEILTANDISFKSKTMNRYNRTISDYAPKLLPLLVAFATFETFMISSIVLKSLQHFSPSIEGCKHVLFTYFHKNIVSL